MDFTEVTQRYFSKWIGQDNILKQPNNEINWIYSADRNVIQNGYSQKFDLYIFQNEKKIFISYGDLAGEKLEQVKQQCFNDISLERIIKSIQEVWKCNVSHDVKYIFTNGKSLDTLAQPLGEEDYDKFESFFLKANPACEKADWIHEYFMEMVQAHICCGCFVDGELVSCTDSPVMPYMEEEVQEVGINTLKKFQGNGYATLACKSCLGEILKNGKCPQWSTSSTNIASQKLAGKLGFVKLADVYTITF